MYQLVTKESMRETTYLESNFVKVDVGIVPSPPPEADDARSDDKEGGPVVEEVLPHE